MVWHVPSAFELALPSDSWHEIEHACFLFSSVLFWWPVVQPFPSESRWPRWCTPLYLFLGMFPGGALGAFLAFLTAFCTLSIPKRPLCSASLRSKIRSLPDRLCGSPNSSSCSFPPSSSPTACSLLASPNPPRLRSPRDRNHWAPKVARWSSCRRNLSSSVFLARSAATSTLLGGYTRLPPSAAGIFAITPSRFLNLLRFIQGSLQPPPECSFSQKIFPQPLSQCQLHPSNPAK
jgi:hypothetical protein